QRLADYARFCGADGILYTCSAFGPAIEAVQQKVLVPVLKPNEAMFREAISRGGKIVLLVTFEPSVAPLRAEFDALSEGRNIALQTVLVEKAMAALASGDAATHNRLIAEAAQKTDGAETIVLAQFSMAQARPAVEAVTSVPVLTAPDSAVLAMRPHFDQSD
ncbi:MAG: aspartate/glutamate racemase family protein, partial [Pseudomonadota bacterium]